MCGTPSIPPPPPPPPPPAPPPPPVEIRDPISDPAMANEAARSKSRRTGRSKLRIGLGSTKQSKGSGLSIKS